MNKSFKRILISTGFELVVRGSHFKQLQLSGAIYSLMFLLAFNPSSVLSAQPDWAVNASDFEYTMTITGVAVFQCVESMDEDDIVGAFANGEVRGVQRLDTDFQGRKLAYMIIYDNDFSGTEITFKLYDASEDAIFDVIHSISFLSDGRIGDADDPFMFKTDYGLASLFLTGDSIHHDAIAGTAVAEIFAVSDMQDTVSVLYEFVDDAQGPDNSYFSITDSLLILLEDVNAEVNNSYQIHLSGTDENGCVTNVVFVLPLTGGVITGTDNLINNPNLVMIYPNPANRTFHFATEKKIDLVNIFGINGNLVYSISEPTGSKSIDVSGLESQMYIVICYMDGMIEAKKLMIQH